ncbi:hypothetical protein [Pseudomonas mosselii]|uniref:hypothetical protein n=1 Tax=Pseudomonas mosselii TaxID=78327 RepID=UPI00164540A8|nr:hypothetical protein [Pseudomonas mosselii]MBC3456934.1 hypothetical protein [Pseudomonas mosselii]
MARPMASNVTMEDPPLNDSNRELATFPPADDFPVCIDRNGNVLSRFGDISWTMDVWVGKITTFNFGPSDLRKVSPWLSSGDAYFFKLVLILLMWVIPASISPSTLVSQYGRLRRLLKFCSDNQISVADLHRFPHLVSAFIDDVGPLGGHYVTMLRGVYDHQEVLGFKILTLEQISQLFWAGKSRSSVQTPYIPSRIHDLHLLRSFEMLDDYNSLASSFEGLFDCLWLGYVENNGDPRTWSGKLLRPTDHRNKFFLGTFECLAETFGVKATLIKWMSRRPSKSAKIDLSSLSSFFNSLCLVGASCIASLSGMRKNEINDLRVDCYQAKLTDRGMVYFISGETTKTIKDDDARWVTCEDVAKAVNAMSSISKLRMKIAVAMGIEHAPDEVSNPYLVSRSYEPWSKDFRGISSVPTFIRKAIGASELHRQCPILFLPNDLVISDEDFREAVSVNPDLDVKRFAVGKQWSFAFHQYRRTLMVNASLSEEVSPQSMQYQAKHLHLSMGMYYGRNYSGLAFNALAKEEYIEAAYETMARKAAKLRSPTFVSLISPIHKQRAISFMEGKTLKQLAKMGRSGEMVVKETLMGVCLNTEHCEYGSADYVLACDKCPSGLASKENLPLITKLDSWLEEKLDEAPGDSPRKDALKAQREFTQRLINVVLVEDGI